MLKLKGVVDELKRNGSQKVELRDEQGKLAAVLYVYGNRLGAVTLGQEVEMVAIPIPAEQATPIEPEPLAAVADADDRALAASLGHRVQAGADSTKMPHQARYSGVFADETAAEMVERVQGETTAIEAQDKEPQS